MELMPAYIDPTGGLPPSAWGIVLATLGAALAAVLATAKLYGRTIVAALRRRWRGIALLAVVAGCATFLFWKVSTRSNSASSVSGKRVLVLAFDGLDPNLLDQYMAEGRLPNFSRLAKTGVYRRLATTNPPQSPVAWSSFITGTDPHAHGVYDFLKRDPRTYAPDLTISDRRTMRLPWKGKPFWESQHSIRDAGLVALRLPVSFPPPTLNGRLLSGMGVWDARGTEGTYFYFSTAPRSATQPSTDKGDLRGMSFELRRDADGTFRGDIPGPYRAGQPDALREPFQLIPKSDGSAELRLQGQTFSLRTGQWSDWIKLRFKLGTFAAQDVDVVTRALYRADRPTGGRSLYVSPLNFDPANPLYAISHPKSYAAELSQHAGCFHTRGMPYDTQALNDGVISDAEFLAQWRTIMDEDERLLAHELSRFRAGVLFSYFEGPDILQHMFWRTIDDQHPLHSAPDTAEHRNVIAACYERCDAILGRSMAAVGSDGAVVVLSDHGFAPFRRAVHVNAILRDAGYLGMKSADGKSGELFESVDWSRTRAYAVGFNAVYLNRAGREGQGVIPDDEATPLAALLAQTLESFTDPDTGERPIKRVHILRRDNANPDVTPDLIIGYARGYRASWETALGAVPQRTTEPNTRKWSGDHCIDPDEVPGVFLSTDRTLDAKSLVDVSKSLGNHLAH